MERPRLNKKEQPLLPVCCSSPKRLAQETPIGRESHGSSRDDLGLILRTIRRSVHMCVNEIRGAQTISVQGVLGGDRTDESGSGGGATKLLQTAWGQQQPEYERHKCCSVHRFSRDPEWSASGGQ